MKLAWDAANKVDRHDGAYHRDRSDDLYHTARWTRLSRAFRNNPKHALCAECLKKGILTPAAVVDHIVPWPVCEDFFDKRNLQPLCERCNHDKGQRDKALIAQWRKDHPAGVGGSNR